jgi:hypothetical protein
LAVRPGPAGPCDHECLCFTSRTGDHPETRRPARLLTGSAGAEFYPQAGESPAFGV